MSKRNLLIVLFVVLLTFSLAACGQESTDPPDNNNNNNNNEEVPAFDGELLIGIMVPTTGSEATYGKDMENAITLAVDEINAAGGVLGKKLVTVTGDDGCDPQMASAASSMLVSKDVVAVVGGYCSGATLPDRKSVV